MVAGLAARSHFAPPVPGEVHLWETPFKSAEESRAVLVELLAAYSGVSSTALRIGAAPGGKPCLTDERFKWLRFNAAHSGEIALHAFACDREVGVDVEEVRFQLPIAAVASRFFTQAEQKSLSALSPGTRVVASFDCWTRKEAYLKALGIGITVRLDKVEVGLSSSPADISGWHLQRLTVGPDYAASLAVQTSPGAPPPTARFMRYAYHPRTSTTTSA